MFISKRRAIHLLINVSGIISCLSCVSPRGSDYGTGELSVYFDSIFTDSEPGGAVLVMHQDKVLFSNGYGLADLVSRDTITTRTLFNIGSISKTFVANAILKLRDEGKLSLDDSLIQYFPEFKTPSIASRVKIRHLLTHTSGLPDNRRVYQDTVFYLTARDAGNWYPETQVEELMFEPGSKFQYSNPAFNGLALIIEKVTGMKWQDYVTENIFRPAGMRTSTITDGPYPQTGVSHGYVLNHGKWIEDDYGEEPTFAAAGNGGVWSSVEELALYEKALRESTLLSKESILESRTIQYRGNSDEQTNWSWFSSTLGLSWFINTTRRDVTVIGHTGTQGGFIANYVSIPEADVFFTILCNSPRDIYAMSDRIMEWLDAQGLLQKNHSGL